MEKKNIAKGFVVHITWSDYDESLLRTEEGEVQFFTEEEVANSKAEEIVKATPGDFYKVSPSPVIKVDGKIYSHHKIYEDHVILDDQVYVALK